ncbi:MAG TPA: branched-chain amino acid ABC transporter permease [Azospirillaceae bacterium]|nr:branched-chain amino acid ABC transporter permease [Azospirillaceae bacterium]
MGEFDLLTLLEFSLSGLSVGALYALTAVGFVVVYKATRVINFAVGDFMMLGAYLFFGLAAGAALPIWLAIVLALAGTGLAGALVERVVFRRMLGESAVSVFMVTIGLASIMVGLVELIWTADPRTLPEFMPDEPFFIPVGVGEAFLASKNGWGLAVSALVIAGFLLAFRFWRGGVALRATAADQQAAYGMGIDVPGVFSFAWILGAVSAAGAGILIGALAGISSAMGAIGLSVLVVVILGGLDSILGALVGGLFIGWLEAMVGLYLGGEYRLVVTFVVLLLILVVKPYGLFGTREIERL